MTSKSAFYWTLGLLATTTFVGSVYLSEYHKIVLGRTCKNHMLSIEEAKKKFRQANPNQTPERASDLKAHFKFRGYPMCPWGGRYVNEFDLNKKTECTCNGDPQKEPSTSAQNPLANGFCDIAPEGEVITVFTKIWDKAEKISAQISPYTKLAPPPVEPPAYKQDDPLEKP